jgi:DNA-binding LacI/PurR family transcriptional regulator
VDPSGVGRLGESPDGPRSVSIRDVAAAAGVSYQTVSRVINGHPSVRGSTRDRVLTTITELGFRPNRAARALAGGPAQSVTVLTSNTTLYGYAAVLQGVEEAARAADFGVGVRVVESAGPGAVQDAVSRATESGSALIVVAYDAAGAATLAAVPDGVPMVAAVETPAGDEGSGRPWVWINDREAAVTATNYLLGLGHQTVHHVAIPSSVDSGQRLAGWRSALTSAGAETPEPLQAGWDSHSGHQAGRELAADPAVTAVLCGNDDLALGVMRAMFEAGRAVPGEVSIVGFDDTPQSAYFVPALTTVRLDFTELGRAAFALLHERMGGQAAAVANLEPELIVRESSGAPPGQAGGVSPGQVGPHGAPDGRSDTCI